jgi:hypothetical protein
MNKHCPRPAGLIFFLFIVGLELSFDLGMPLEAMISGRQKAFIH